jgi:hypothetical protein
MSLLKVNSLQDLGADPVITNGVLAKSALPSGSILQILETQKTTSFSTTSTTSVNITGLEVTITPNSASSKFLIIVNGYDVQQSNVNNFTRLGARRDSTDIGQNAIFQAYSGSASGSSTAIVLDSPNTTSAITYRGRLSVNATTGTVNTSSITVMEVAG